MVTQKAAIIILRIFWGTLINVVASILITIVLISTIIDNYLNYCFMYCFLLLYSNKYPETLLRGIYY
ncbi:MAG: hypothetical protein A3F72_21780 [Bacteroidetes bacterium RIFCSPLOWO2_12_FULL_35_15]|nr:MAG: hypothetical protein A3F72_21780 [Bacteroidetes bacterium RIFCSPLOWO2_12_FULL_35_15]